MSEQADRMYVAYDPDKKAYLHRGGRWRAYPYLWRRQSYAKQALGWAQGRYYRWGKQEVRNPNAEVIEVSVSVKRVVRTEVVEYQEVA